MSDGTRGEDPRTKFQAAILERMAQRDIEPEHLSALTSIPTSRLMLILGGRPGAALLSDLIALAVFFEISVDSFFT
jgi:hypothetical protein